MSENNRGINSNQEVKVDKLLRDVRTTKEKFADFMQKPENFLMIMGVLIGSLIIMPYLTELVIGVGFFLLNYTKKQKFFLPFRMPLSSKMLDHNDPKPGGLGIPGQANGITFFGNEKKSDKELWFKNDDMRTHILIFGSTGAGKALKNNELIHTPQGWKKNKDLKVGDLVSTPYGQSPIQGIFPQGKLDLFRLKFEDGRFIDVSGDHLWEVHSEKFSEQEILGVKSKLKAKVINTLDIKELLSKSSNTYNDNFYIPLTLPIYQKENGKNKEALLIDPYNFGSMLSQAKGDKISQLSDKVFNREKREFLESLNFTNVDEYSVFIPKEYRCTNLQTRLSVVRGFLDSCAKVNDNTIIFSVHSEKLTDNLKELLFSLGAVVSVYKREMSMNSAVSTYKFDFVVKHGNLSLLFNLPLNKDKIYHTKLHLQIGDLYDNSNFLEYENNFYNTEELLKEDNELAQKLIKIEDKKQAIFDEHNKGLKLKIISVEDLSTQEECQCIKIKDPRGLFITKDYLVTHNTETLLSLAFNALVHGSGLIYVDGKGDVSLFTKIFAMARVMGREDDLLVINYMTGSRDVFGAQKEKLSNTLNPFSSGSSGGLTELLVSLMDDSGGDGGMWKGRAISLVSAIMMALVYLREQKEILLDVDVIREYLILDNIIKLYKRRDLPTHIRQALKAYLVSLPGFQESAPKQGETTLEQHGYLQMQFTKLLGSLADAYGYIFRTNLGEVDFKDIVLNRRILVVLLPALEKSTDELANLGKIIVACLKQMMAEGLGSKLEGDYADVIEIRPTTSPTPFMCVLDEYGYYAVKGSAVMPAQARSLGFSMIFAGQDLPAFQKADEKEAMSIVANCNIKIFMKLEDPKDTYELFEKSVGEAYVATVSGYQMNQGGLMGGFVGMQNANIDLRKRGNLLDLKDQQEGESHIIFKSAVIRARMFYADPPKPRTIQVNYFVKVEPPDKKEITQLDSGLNELLKNITNKAYLREVEESLEDEEDLITEIEQLLNKYSNLGATEQACAVIATLGNTLQSSLDKNISAIANIYNNEDDDEEEFEPKINIFSKDEEKEGDDDEDDEDDFDEDEDEDETSEETQTRTRAPSNRNVNVFMDEEKTTRRFEEIEKMSGASEYEARESSQRLSEDMKKATDYPTIETPEEKEPEEILDMLKELDESFDLGED
jgi:intracellular multiplication protein IcmO